MPELLFPDPPLADGVIALRQWHYDDLAQRFAGFSDPLCQRFGWALTEPCTEDHARRGFEEEEWARLSGAGIDLAIVDVADSIEILGACSVYDVRLSEGRASVGYWLAAHARRRGVATRAVRLLTRWIFDDLGVARIELTCGPDNLGSQRVAERCGFQREGVLRSHMPFKGGRRDSVVFSLLPTDPA
ncbi:GNAT family N-acetyltransferase [Nocardia alni]|uniref:GNAT family N-acetyltransferase n=1 Tax=Nocardia alni TaxID=2815723 RepID=UPI001C2253CE|nr:GNAT family protein [Nocardia alni]